MNTTTPYEDMQGFVSADITDSTEMNMLHSLAENYGIDTEKYKVIGLTTYGTEDLILTFLCIDNQQSTDDRKHITSINIKDGVEFSDLFKNMSIVLFSKYHQSLSGCEIDEEISLDSE